MPPRELSVVIVRFAGGSSIRSTLEALGASPAGSDAPEILVGHGPSHAPDSALRDAFPPPLVQWIAAPSDDPAAMRSAAVRAATAPIIACTEDHCVPDPAWAAHIVRAHARSSAAVIGGPIDKRVPDDADAWAAYLIEYGRYMPPVTAGRVMSCSDCNVSYKHAALREVASEWQTVFHETAVHRAIVARGGILEIDPAIVVRQSRVIDATGFRRERRHHGRTYGAQRAADRPLPVRAVLALGAAAIPFLFVARARQRVRDAGRAAELPAGTWGRLFGASVQWAVGEGVGVLTGRGS